jgi:hypothetical protein
MVEKQEVTCLPEPIVAKSAVDLYVEVFDINRRLKSLGLTVDILLDAVREGFTGRSNCSELDPPMFPGQTMWAHTVRRLRQGTAPIGWKPDNANNYCVALSPDGIAVAVATGDANTGRPDAIPSTSSPKGPCTAEAVATNQLTLDLRLPGGEVLSQTVDVLQRQTWLLLIYLDQSEVRAELSLPVSFDEQERVTGWRERIILPSVDLDPDQIELPSGDSGDIDIAVRRRA